MEESNYAFLWGDYAEAWSVQTNLERCLKFRDETLWNQVDNMIQVMINSNCRTFHSIEDLKNDVEKGKNFLNKEFSNKFIESMEKINGIINIELSKESFPNIEEILWNVAPTKGWKEFFTVLPFGAII